MLCWEMGGRFLLRGDLGGRRSNLNWILHQRNLLNHLTGDRVILTVDDANLGCCLKNFPRRWLVERVVGHGKIQEIGRLLPNMLYTVVTLVVIYYCTPAWVE
jgi:hypothetical protein